MSERRCSCTGGCGSRWCLGWMAWGKPCGMRHGHPHPANGHHQTIRSGRCSLCRDAEHTRQARLARRAELLRASDGHTRSLFSLVAGGELA